MDSRFLKNYGHICLGGVWVMTCQEGVHIYSVLILLMIKRDYLCQLATSYWAFTYLGGIKPVSGSDTDHSQYARNHPGTDFQNQSLWSSIMSEGTNQNQTTIIN